MCGWGAFFVYVFDKLFPPLVAAGVGAFVLARILENHRARRDFLSREVQEICSSLKEYWSVCREYWLPDALKNQADLEEKILYLQGEIFGAVRLLGENFDEEFRQTANSHCADIAAFATGGRFKDPQRKSDPQRVAQIRAACLALRGHLQSSRKAKLQRSGK